jgi:phage repressor protein C with HTH and peptisase S24 domain
MDFKTGGQQVILRLVEAYGFTTRQMLCDHLGVSKSTLATRFMRDIFPAEWVIQCALETKASLEWLISGKGVPFENSNIDVLKVPKVRLMENKIFDAGYYFFDKAFISNELKEPLVVIDSETETTYISEKNNRSVTDGIWLLEVEGDISIRNLTKLPGGRIRISKNNTQFDCEYSDVKLLALLKYTFKKI